jgi:hypothetical protein
MQNKVSPLNIFKGTIARPAIQCVDPRSGRLGDWLFTGDRHKDLSAIVSPLFRDLAELHQWAMANNWAGVGNGYVYGGAA